MNDESTSGTDDESSDNDVAIAKVHSAQRSGSGLRRGSRLWFVTAASLLVALVLIGFSVGTSGLNITIRFENGHGIQPGDAVRYRGIDVGKVVSLELNDLFDGVTVQAVLNPASAGLARQSSQFWIERPLLSATEVRGLDTLIGGRFIGVTPGPAAGPRQVEFEGISSAPSGEIPEESLEIVLESNDRGGLQRGAPVLYRGLQVGHIISVALSPDAASVEARTLILPAFKPLVRNNSVFWETSGIDVSVGLSGLRLSVDTLSTIVLGGVSMATPDAPGEIVSTGYRFSIHDNVDDESMLRWKPRIRIGELAELPHGPPPTLARAALRWREGILGIRHTRRRQGWVVLLNATSLLGPAEMFLADPSDPNHGGVLEVDGQQIEVGAQHLQARGGLVWYQLPESAESWSTSVSEVSLRTPGSPEDFLLVTSSHVPPIVLAAERVTQVENLWRIDPSVTLGSDWHGAAVIAAADGCLIGIVVEQQEQFFVAPVSAE